MTERYNRWQGLAIAQLSVAIALLSALSLAGLGTGISLLQNPNFLAALQCKRAFAASLGLSLVCAFCGCVAVITRTLDFRLTARVARSRGDTEYNRSLKLFGMTAERYGQLSWTFFWSAFIAFAVAGFAFALSVTSVYAPLLFGDAPAA